MKINKDNYKTLALFLLLGLALGYILFFKGCESKKPEPINIPTKQQDSFRTVIKWVDSVRVNEVIKWRKMTRITDSVKCYTEIIPFIQACDTIIKIDSIEISALKGLVKLDSNIQVILFKRIRSDSTLIVKLNKKVKRNRRMALFFGAIVAGGVGVKLIP